MRQFVPASRLQIGGVDADIGPFSFNGPVEEGFDFDVDFLTKPRYRALGDARHPDGLDVATNFVCAEIVNRPRRDALNVSFLDHGRQGLFGYPARLEEAREIAAQS